MLAGQNRPAFAGIGPQLYTTPNARQSCPAQRMPLNKSYYSCLFAVLLWLSWRPTYIPVTPFDMSPPLLGPPLLAHQHHPAPGKASHLRLHSGCPRQMIDKTVSQGLVVVLGSLVGRCQ